MEHVPDTTSTDDSESGSYMEVHGDEEWVRDYEEMSETNTWSRDTADRSDGHHMDGEDMIDRVVISQEEDIIEVLPERTI